MPAPTPAPHNPPPLRFEVRELTARTHRGDYTIRTVGWDDAYAYFQPFGGGFETLGPSMYGKHAVRRVTAACDAHAAAQPVWPPLLGWPADGDLEATLALEAAHG